MIRDFFKRFYRRSVSTIKKWDKLTHYKIGDLVRKITNVNRIRHWDKYLSQRGDFWRNFPYEFLLDVLPKDTAFSLLDIGCAMGDGCELLKKHFPQAHISGVDFSIVGIEKAKSNLSQVNYFLLDISQEEPPQEYDYITLVHILEHFNDPFPIVDKCLKFVKKALYIITPYEKDFDSPMLYSKGEHRYLFNERTFIKYHCTVLKIIEYYIDKVKNRYILYKITP
jgi:2-polyprenyl-3-methyl-5-hydroxy-6-metoxy-1,4-benzoquinol methylase